MTSTLHFIVVAAIVACCATASSAQVLPSPSTAPQSKSASSAALHSPVAPRAARPIQAQEQVPDLLVTLTAPTDIAQVGTAIAMTLTIEPRNGATYVVPALGSVMGPFEVVDLKRETLGTGSDRKCVLSFGVLTYESGELELPPIEVAWKGRDGTAHVLSIGPTPIEVVSLLGADFDPSVYRDIKGEVAIDVGAIWPWVVGALAVIGMGALVWFLRSRARVASAQPLTAGEWAELELERLRRDDLVGHGDLHGFWVRLSAIVREYLERRFSIAAREQTTKEFLEAAQDHPMLGAQHRHLLKDFLRAADMVKFAAHRPAAIDCERGLGAAHDLIRDTAATVEIAKPEMELAS